MEASARQFDFDWLVIGSGFGGSVSALRLSEKGYRSACWSAGGASPTRTSPSPPGTCKRYFWAPRVGMRGILRLSTFKDIAVVSGCGVGGGSLGYANTLYVPPSQFFEDAQWSGLDDWERALAPHYAEAQRMLGVVVHDNDDPADQLLRELGEELGVADTYRKTPVGVFFGEPGKTVPDPYFGGEGPDRTGCMQCGRCMVGCPHGAKNTLVKNYLWFAERRGAQVMPDRTVVDIRPLGAEDGSDGYAIVSERSGVRSRARPPHADGARRDRRRRRARHEQAAPALPPGRLAAARLVAPRRARAHEQRGDPRGHGPARLRGGLDEAGRDHVVDLPGPAHAHRDRHLRRGGRLDERALHAAGRRRHARDAAAQAARADRPPPGQVRQGPVAARLVAPHDHRARDADARQRDRAAARS